MLITGLKIMPTRCIIDWVVLVRMLLLSKDLFDEFTSIDDLSNNHKDMINRITELTGKKIIHLKYQLIIQVK